MAHQSAIQSIGNAVRRHYRLWMLPRLVELPEPEWETAIKQASAIEFDGVEQIGLISGVAFVAYLSRSDIESATSLSLFLEYVAQFVVAMPLLLLVVGPVYLRRMRRGLESVLSQRHKVAGKATRHAS